MTTHVARAALAATLAALALPSTAVAQASPPPPPAAFVSPTAPRSRS